MVYLSGVTDHHVQDASIVDHIVELVENEGGRDRGGQDSKAAAE